MAKPKIVIVDTDYDYIVPLQIKFIESFYEKIELEIITDESYLREYLSSPRKAEIFIISEQLYSQDVHRHNFSNIFVLVEEQSEVEVSEYGVTRLQKYTNLKELFNVIIGKSAGTLRESSSQKKSSQIIVVCSAHGGVGKTTVAVGISACLTKSYKKVLYINADRLQNFQYLLADQSPISSSEIYSQLANPTQSLFEELRPVIRQEGFSYLPPFRAALMSLGIQYKVFAIIADAAKKTNIYDYIIVDVNTGFDENFALLLKIADKVMVINEDSAYSIYATNHFVTNINGISAEKYMFICNKFRSELQKVTEALPRKYRINEYINFFDSTATNDVAGLSKDNGMQKVAFLLV